VVILLAGCLPDGPDAGDAPILDVSVGESMLGSVSAGSWCRSSFGIDACVAADGPVTTFDVECGVEVGFAPREPGGWLLQDANVPVEELDGRWSVGKAAGDIVIDMDGASTEASWSFILERSDC
jgi:hypothetical protein